jgi:cysteine-rich repeat protein
MVLALFAGVAGCGFNETPRATAGGLGRDAAVDGGASTFDAGGGAGEGAAGEVGAGGAGGEGGEGGRGGDSGRAGSAGGAGDAGADAGGSADAGEVECTRAASCPEPDSFCIARACIDGECATRDVTAGRALPDQNAGDCARLECDGAGEVVAVDDDGDAPPDASDCVVEACSGGAVVETPVAVDTPCDDAGGQRCNGAGACVECTESAQCAAGVCLSGQCADPGCDDDVHNGDETDMDCGGSCPPCAVGDTCEAPPDCAPNVCLDDECALPTCGDGITTPPELCDDDNSIDADGCDSDCRPTCGNGEIDGTEACDDGDFASADGCSASCAIEPYYQCTRGEPSVCTRQEGICSGGNDDDGDGSPDATDSDCNLALTVPSCPGNQTLYVFNSRQVPRVLFDFVTIRSDITVPAIGTVRRVVLRVNILHPWVSDLEFSLTAPDGTTRLASFHNGDDGNNYSNTRFRQGAMTSIVDGTAPFFGEYRPEEDFNGFNGDPAAGTWRLTVLDDAEDDQGTLNSYSLAICAN